MARVSIYVPDDLKGKMDKQDQVNWSSVAQKAFEVELRLYPDWTESKMSNVIERLRASKAKQVDEVRQSGFDAGRQWAEQDADFLSLQKLGEKFETDEVVMHSFHLGQYLGLGDGPGFFRAAAGIDDWHTEPSPYFLEGFIIGARAVWKEVQDKL